MSDGMSSFSAPGSGAGLERFVTLCRYCAFAVASMRRAMKMTFMRLLRILDHHGICRAEVLPIKPLVLRRDPVRCGVLIAHGAHLLHPLAEGQQQFAVDKISHVHRSVRQMIFDVIDFMEE